MLYKEMFSILGCCQTTAEVAAFVGSSASRLNRCIDLLSRWDIRKRLWRTIIFEPIIVAMLQLFTKRLLLSNRTMHKINVYIPSSLHTLYDMLLINSILAATRDVCSDCTLLVHSIAIGTEQTET